MRILYLTDVFPPECGGSGWSVYFFARGLRKLGHQVDILTLDGVPRVYDGFEVRAKPLPSGKRKLIDNWLRESRGLPIFAQTLAPEMPKYDIVHAHHKWSILAAGMTGSRFF